VTGAAEVARVEPVPSGAGSTLRAWADEAVAAAHIARSLALTPFVPDSLRVRVPNDVDEEVRRTTANVGAALLVGQEVGLAPMAALRSIDIVNGTPALRAIALRAIVQSRGHHIYTVESTQTRAIVAGRRFGTEPEQRSTWTIDRARQLGLVGRDQWKRQPTAMLLARASAECARLIGSDAILGIAYAAEELRDGGDFDAEAVERPTANTTRTMRRGIAPQAAARATVSPDSVPVPPPAEDEPPTDEGEAAPWASQPEPPYIQAAPPIIDAPLPEPEPAERPMNAAQRRAVFAHLNELGITDDGTRHTYVSNLLGKPVASFVALTDTDAQRLLDALHIEVINRLAADEPPPEPPEDDPQLFPDSP
jgi:hypothetical protein